MSNNCNSYVWPSRVEALYGVERTFAVGSAYRIDVLLRFSSGKVGTCPGLGTDSSQDGAIR